MASGRQENPTAGDRPSQESHARDAHDPRSPPALVPTQASARGMYTNGRNEAKMLPLSPFGDARRVLHELADPAQDLALRHRPAAEQLEPRGFEGVRRVATDLDGKPQAQRRARGRDRHRRRMRRQVEQRRLPRGQPSRPSGLALEPVGLTVGGAAGVVTRPLAALSTSARGRAWHNHLLGFTILVQTTVRQSFVSQIYSPPFPPHMWHGTSSPGA